MNQIFVKSLDGCTLMLDISPHETIADIKDKIYGKNGVSPNRQRLVFAGKNLCDALTLSDYGVQNESSVWLMPHVFRTG